MGITKKVFLLGTLIGIAACQQLPIKLAGTTPDCTQSHSQSTSEFYSYSMGTSLDDAKNNARADLARQISSSMSSTSTSDVKDINGRIDTKYQSLTQLSSDNIPLDHHRFDKACRSGGQYHIGIRLAKKDLENTVAAKRKNTSKAVNNLLQRAKTASSYERYVIRAQLINETSALQLYDRLLSQYSVANTYASSDKLIKQAQSLIDNSSNLNIAIKTEPSVQPLLPLLETALTDAKLTYSKHNRDTAIIIHLNGKVDNKRTKNHYITHLNAQLLVRRTDTNELLAKVDLGKNTATSSLGFDEALSMALKGIEPNAKRQLRGDSHTVRNKLGIQ